MSITICQKCIKLYLKITLSFRNLYLMLASSCCVFILHPPRCSGFTFPPKYKSCSSWWKVLIGALCFLNAARGSISIPSRPSLLTLRPAKPTDGTRICIFMARVQESFFLLPSGSPRCWNRAINMIPESGVFEMPTFFFVAGCGWGWSQVEITQRIIELLCVFVSCHEVDRNLAKRTLICRVFLSPATKQSFRSNPVRSKNRA